MDCIANNGFNVMGDDCGSYPECDGCKSDFRIIPYEEFQLRGALRGGK
ncbi:MAG: hypothetical protein O8C61_05555 [Candidatus Methanoperedens sp.]|nr:hypothetical protein [Candidatus Methanoperedens sp.]